MTDVSGQYVPLREVIDSYIGGGWGKEEPHETHTSPGWVIRGADLAAVRIGDTSGCPLRYHKESNLRSRKLVPGDLIFEVSGGSKDQPVGRNLLVSANTLSHFNGDVMCASFCKLVRPDPTKVDPAFLFWNLQALYDDRSVLQYQVQSTGISNFKFEVFLNDQVIWLPPLSVQRRVACTLSDYDVLIDNSTRRVRILEEMAEAIYREWFVELRYPGHDDVPLIESDVGPIPEGWCLTEVKKLVKRLRPGRTYRETDVHDQGSVPVIDQSRSGLLGFYNGSPDIDASLAAPVLVFGDHTCRMEVMTEPFSVGPNVVPFQPVGDLPPLMLFELIRGLVSTAEYKRHWSELMAKRVVVPPTELANKYSATVESLIELRRVLLAEPRVLARCRDLLLPRLISGQLEASALESLEVA